MTVKHIFTDRFGGVSRGIYESFNLGLRRGDSEEAVRENYRRLAGKIGCGRFVTANQEHTDTILRVDASFAKTDIFAPVDYVADGLITSEKDLALIVFTADCVPVLLEGEGEIAAVHAGWRGTAKGIAAKAAAMMTCPAERIKAYIGPSIGACCYETGDDVRDAMRLLMGKEAEAFFADGRVDLKGLNRRQLEMAGVGKIEVSGECTMCMHDKYWSHRYTSGRRGSQCGVIVMSEDR